jgi:CubicO group peptidase (beta-lactamase class C family)
MRKLIPILLTLLTAFVVVGQQKTDGPDSQGVGPNALLSFAAALDAEIAKAAAKDTPGVAVLVIKDGKTVYRRSRGLADLDAKTRLGTQSQFYIASLSKQFTAISIIMLEERGKLGYDDKLVKYFPDLASFAGDITVRQLLTHTSGLLDHLDVVKDEVSGWTNDDVIKLLKRENRVLFPPGEKVSYTNSGYVLLSMIVEKVSGESFPVFLKKNIFDPLKMNSTGVAVRGVTFPNRVRGYSQVDGKWTPSEYDAFTTGGGGIYSTLEDMEKWDRSLSEKPLISSASMRLASTANKLNNGKPTAYGFGWLAEFAPKGDLANVWYVASFGDFKGFKAMHKRIPERRFSVIILANNGEFPWNIFEKAQVLFAK